MFDAARDVLAVFGVDRPAPACDHAQHRQTRPDQVVQQAQLRRLQRYRFLVTVYDFRRRVCGIFVPANHGGDAGSQIVDQRRVSHIPKVDHTHDAAGIVFRHEQVIGHDVVMHDLRPEFGYLRQHAFVEAIQEVAGQFPVCCVAKVAQIPSQPRGMLQIPQQFKIRGRMKEAPQGQGKSRQAGSHRSEQRALGGVVARGAAHQVGQDAHPVLGAVLGMHLLKSQPIARGQNSGYR